MAWGVDHPHGYPGDLYVLTIGWKCIRPRRWRNVVAEPHARRRGHAVGDEQIVLVKQERGTRGLDDRSRGHDVVQVGVAGNHTCDVHTHIPSKSQDLLGLVARIDHARFATPARADDPAIFAEQADHHATHLELDCFAHVPQA